MFRSFGFGNRGDDDELKPSTEESIKNENVPEKTKDEPIPEETSNILSDDLIEEVPHIPKKSHSSGEIDPEDDNEQLLNLKEVRDLRRIHSIKRFEEDQNINDVQTENQEKKSDIPLVGNEETLDIVKKAQSDEEEVDIKHVLHSKLQDMRNRGNIVDEESELQLLNSTYENKAKDSSKIKEDLDKPEENKNSFENENQVHEVSHDDEEKTKESSKIKEDLHKPEENKNSMVNENQVDQVSHDDEEKTKEIPSDEKCKCDCTESKENSSSSNKCGSKSGVVEQTSICNTLHSSMALKCTIGVVLLSIFLGVLFGKRILG
ncbi:hypothetical protein ZOSMA_71G00120 [Zostera marina]|uniref:Uncharacterized protein n=1 Tax=Zostera marina TaxID=29655 RepID=A0A0K9NQ76_ZOSMR|nr:hypothetical protein ZOSMA_71G00120 [Zostera marina]